MGTIQYTVTTLKEHPELYQKQEDICARSWPEFIKHDPIADSDWDICTGAYPEHQILVLTESGSIAAVVSTVPLLFRQPLQELPDRGWDWGLQKARADLESHADCNMLLALQVVVHPDERGKGYSALSLKVLREHIKKYNFEALLVPVRPSQKSLYPLLSMDDYLTWKNRAGLPFDAWLRTHVVTGGRVIRICEKAMTIPGTVKEWEAWTTLTFQQSGQYIVPGALNPVSVDIERDAVLYVEPNVWVVHS